MVSSNTESNITVTYEDSDGTLDFSVTGGGSVSEAFKTISVSGQSDVVADAAADTLTLVAGSNMTITTDASNDTITFASSGSGGSGNSVGNAFTKNTFTGDGSTTAFTLSISASNEDNLLVFIDGVYQADNVYTVSGTTLTFATAPVNSRVIEVFTVEAGIVGSAPVIDTMTGDGSDTTLALSTTPTSENQTFVTIDGVVQHKDTYAVSGSTLTFSAAPPTGTKVECITFTNVAVTTFQDADGDTKIQVEESSDEDKIRFDTGGTERMIIDASGNVGIGETSPANLLHVKASDVSAAPIDTALMVLEKSGTNYLSFMGANTNTQGVLFGDADDNDVAGITYNHSSNYMAFNTAASERMRIHSGGAVSIGITTAFTDGNTNSGSGSVHISNNGARALHLQRAGSNGEVVAFYRGGISGEVGNISVSTSSTAYNTSSDYRLKENVNYEFNALTRVKELKPARFNFIVDADKTVDGFLAHEVSDIVPEAITGEKDGEEMQGIDQSKLVPLLTKAIQEQQELIETLTTRIETLEGGE
mgnify:FL=1